MHRLLLLSASLLFAATSFAQSLQPITVQEYHERADKTPLADVGVTVTNAGAAMTTPQGEATLRFRTLHAGDRVQVRRIELPGYEVFNQEALDQWTISPAVPFRIVLCKSDRLRSLREHYMRIASANYDKQYKADQARLSQLRKQSKLQEEEYQRQLQALQDQYDQQLENLDNYVDQFARIDLAELSQQESTLIDLIQSGKTDEAIALYEQQNYPAQYEQQTRELAEISRAQERLSQLEAEKREQRKAIEASIGRQVNTYQLAGGAENWAKVTALLKAVADADTTNTDALWRYIMHCAKQNRFDEGEQYVRVFERQTIENLDKLSNAYLALGLIQSQIQQYDEAESSLLSAVQLQNQWCQQDPNRSRYQLMVMYCYLHSFLCESYQFEKAYQYTQLIEEGLISLSSEGTNEYWKELVRLRSEKAKCIAFVDEDLQRAEQYAKDNIRYCKQQMNPKFDESEHQCLYDVIARIFDILDAEGKTDELEVFMKEVVQIYHELYRYNPDKHLMGTVEAYANLADTQVSIDKLDEAEGNLSHALELLPILIENYNNKCPINEMCIYDTAASLYLKKNEAGKSADYARRCMEAFRRMPAQMQEAYREVEERWTER